MNRDMLIKAVGDIDDRYIAESSRYSPEEVCGPPEGIKRMKTKRIVSVALAAALILALGAAVYAVSSIHAIRQQALKADLQIEENRADSYVEYDVPGETGSGLVVLSAVSDGEEQRVYVNVAPVAEEELESFPGGLSFAWSIEGSDLGGFAGPQLNPDRSLSGKEEIRAAVMEDAWDPETRTLTLLCYLPARQLRETAARQATGSVMLRVAMYENGREIRCFGSVPFMPTAEERRVFDLGSAIYRSGEKEIELLSLELTPFSAVWRLRYEGDALAHASGASPEQQSWLLLEDKVCVDARIFFSDGSCFSTGGALTCPYEEGAVSLYCSWGRAVDIRDVQRIVLDDLVLWEEG